MFSTRLVTNFDQIRSDWNILLNQTGLNAVFFSALWQETWWNHFGSKKSINIIEVFQGDDIVGIAPLMIEKSVLSFISSTDLVDYGNFIIRDNNSEAYFSIWENILELEWDKCELCSLPANSPILEIYPKLAEDYGFRVEVVKEDVVPRLQLPKTWDNYLDNLSKKKRHEIRRKIRKLESFGKVEFRELKESKLVMKEMDTFFDLHKSSSAKKSQFLNNKRRRFIEDISIKFAENKMLILSLLDIDSSPVAACLGFEYRDSYFLYNSGYNPEFSDLSVGIVANLYAIKNAIIRENTIFDFLRGGEFYKYQLGAEDQYIFRLNISRL